MTIIIQFQSQKSFGQLAEHQCYPGAYFGNYCFIIITVTDSFLWNCTMSYFHIIHKFEHFYHHNTAFQDPTSDGRAVAVTLKVSTVSVSGMLVGYITWHYFYPQTYDLSSDLHWNMLVSSEVFILVGTKNKISGSMIKTIRNCRVWCTDRKEIYKITFIAPNSFRIF
jgi:hypothetical protein